MHCNHAICLCWSVRIEQIDWKINSCVEWWARKSWKSWASERARADAHTCNQYIKHGLYKYRDFFSCYFVFCSLSLGIFVVVVVVIQCCRSQQKLKLKNGIFRKESSKHWNGMHMKDDRTLYQDFADWKCFTQSSVIE